MSLFKRFAKILKKAFRIKSKTSRKRLSRAKRSSKKRTKKHKFRKDKDKDKRIIFKKKRAKLKAEPNRRKNSRHKAKLRKPKKALKEKKPKAIGVITHYFPKVNAAVVKLKSTLAIGEPIRIKGKTTDFRQTVGSLQIDRKPIEKGRAGQEIGLEVFREVRPGDMIFKQTL